MRTITLILSILTILALPLIGLLVWYEFIALRRPQVFLVSVPWKQVPWKYDPDEARRFAEKYGGTWATSSELNEAMQQGFLVDKAGYLSDTNAHVLSAGCENNPLAYFTESSMTGKQLATACSRGYFIKGVKPRSGPVDGTDFEVQPWNDGKWNQWTVKSWSDLVAAFKYSSV